jgi:hypothetical protein
MDTLNIKDWLEILQYFAVILGIPIALIQYVSSSRKERQDKEYETYNALDEKFIDYLKLCLDHPNLDIFDISDKKLNEFKKNQSKEEIIIFTILFSVFERAYTMYFDQGKKIRKEQWNGWESYINDFSQRDNFKEAWKISGETFHEKFQDHMNAVISKKQ